MIADYTNSGAWRPMTSPTRTITVEIAKDDAGYARSRRWWFLAGILIGLWLAAAAIYLPRLLILGVA